MLWKSTNIVGLDIVIHIRPELWKGDTYYQENMMTRHDNGMSCHICVWPCHIYIHLDASLSYWAAATVAAATTAENQGGCYPKIFEMDAPMRGLKLWVLVTLSLYRQWDKDYQFESLIPLKNVKFQIRTQAIEPLNHWTTIFQISGKQAKLKKLNERTSHGHEYSCYNAK